MAQHQGRWPVSVLCEVLQVSRSGLYAYVQRQPSRCRDAEEVALVARVQAIAAETQYNVPQKLDHPIRLDESRWGERNDDDVAAAA